MCKIKRICLYSGPSAGKSVIAAQIFAELKKENYNIELVTEVIKPQAIAGNLPKSFDQFLILAKQIRREDRILPYLDYIVTDSPLLLNAAYTLKYNLPYWQECINVAKYFENKYKGLHIFLDRIGLKYETEGRYENLREAIEMDIIIRDLLIENNLKFKTFKSIDFNNILNYIKDTINEQRESISNRIKRN